jgi:hypothetical protein
MFPTKLGELINEKLVNEDFTKGRNERTFVLSSLTRCAPPKHVIIMK